MRQRREVPRGHRAKALPNVIGSAMQCAKYKTCINTRITIICVIDD